MQLLIFVRFGENLKSVDDRGDFFHVRKRMQQKYYFGGMSVCKHVRADILPRFSWLYVRVVSVIKHFIRKRIWGEIEMKDIWDINTQMVTSLICRKLRFWPLSLGLFLCFKMKKTFILPRNEGHEFKSPYIL